MNVPDEDKLEILASMFVPLTAALAGGTADGDVTADDIIDFFAMGAAAVIDNDSLLTTSRDRRRAIETVAARIAIRVKDIADYREQHGESFLAAALAAPVTGEKPN